MAIGTVDTHKKSKVTVITFVMIQSFRGELNADGCRIETVAHMWIQTMQGRKKTVRTTGH